MVPGHPAEQEESEMPLATVVNGWAIDSDSDNAIPAFGRSGRAIPPGEGEDARRSLRSGGRRPR